MSNQTKMVGEAALCIVGMVYVGVLSTIRTAEKKRFAMKLLYSRLNTILTHAPNVSRLYRNASRTHDLIQVHMKTDRISFYELHMYTITTNHYESEFTSIKNKQ